MARPTKTDSLSEPLANAFAIVQVKGGYVVREYLVPSDSTVHQDGPVDTFGACLGRVTREHARGVK